MNSPVRQFKRKAQVIVGRAGAGLSIADARIKFEVVKTSNSTPNTAIIKIYNLSFDNEVRIKNEFDEVILNAGYENGVLLVFRGNIKHVDRYPEGPDRVTEIEAGDGDTDFRRAVMNETLAAGTSTNQLVERALGSFVGGTVRGEVQVRNTARIRGKVVSGNTRAILDDVARESGANWSIQDGQLTIIGTNSIAPGVAIVLTSESGLLGSPEINDKGIAVKCLMNPQIKVNGALKLDNNSIRAKRQKEKALGKEKEPEGKRVRLDPDGIYKVIKLTHKGDTHGKDWHTESVCVGLDQPIPG